MKKFIYNVRWGIVVIMLLSASGPILIADLSTGFTSVFFTNILKFVGSLTFGWFMGWLSSKVLSKIESWK